MDKDSGRGPVEREGGGTTAPRPRPRPPRTAGWTRGYNGL